MKFSHDLLALLVLGDDITLRTLMITREEIHTLLAKKQAGVGRMRDRQRRVHERMAKLVMESPEAIDRALNKVVKRLENSGECTRDIYLEWYEILTAWSSERIASLLRDDSCSTEQLRACAPFDFCESGVIKATCQ